MTFVVKEGGVRLLKLLADQHSATHMSTAEVGKALGICPQAVRGLFDRYCEQGYIEILRYKERNTTRLAARITSEGRLLLVRTTFDPTTQRHKVLKASHLTPWTRTI